MSTYPEHLMPPDQVASCPRRIRGLLAGRYVCDTTRARYVWEFPPYPQFYLPVADIDNDVLVDEGRHKATRRGTAGIWGLRVGETTRESQVLVFGDDAAEPLRGTARIEWNALDAWFEEDEQIFVHPRNPYARVDAVRSNRAIRVELAGEVLAEADSTVMVFETGLPPRHYLDRTALRLEHLEPSDTVTACPYKGTTSAYWSARIGDQLHEDLAWSYAFPTRQLLPIAGLVAFYDERVDTYLDGVLIERPSTEFS